ncbi:hypothetical protein [Paractinoplanes rishiriensis]|uniref:DUF2157 domain-containing protein n=1 Tax=Paractinoplanes rishiriensis TaxID=1050105 RepID=A0A919K831_9ACTN|nr:hypothetical protein [Actinoplanes rishiriensis]GIF00415.1 hypothetical protein Ari01nite_78790 [Actinoplanes rishiriensis]
MDALSAALDRLVERGVLDRGQAGAVLAEMAAPAAAPKGARRLLGEIAGYLGASFVVGATLLFLGEQWDSLGTAGVVAILAGMAAVLFGAGLVVRLRQAAGDDVRRRLSSTLLTASAAAAAFAVLALLEGDTDDSFARLASALTGLVVVLAGYVLSRSALGQLGVAVAALVAYGNLLEALDVFDTVPFGLGSLGLGVVWAVLAWRRLVTERRLALAIAVVLALFGAQFTIIDGTDAENYLGYVLTTLVAAACFTAYIRIREWVVLAGGVAGATLVVPEFLYDVTDGSLGASGVMLVAGLTLLAGSLAGLRIRRLPDPPDPPDGPTVSGGSVASGGPAAAGGSVASGGPAADGPVGT